MRKTFAFFLALAASVGMSWAAPTIYSGFTVTASSGGLENHEAANLVDGKFTAGTEGTDWTKWSADKSMKISSPSGGPGLFWWVDFQSDAPICITGYILTSSNQLGQTPTAWTLDAKLNEGDSWTTITGVLDNNTLGANALTDVSFNLDKPGTYKYFRFLVSDVDDPFVNGMQLSELRFISPTSDGKSISIADGTANADKVTLSATSASEGETITLTPMAGYDITSFKAISLDNEVAEIFSFPNGGESSYNGTNISGWCRNNYSGYGAEIGEIFEVRFTALGENKVVTQIDAPVTYIENSTISKTTTTSGYFSYDGSAIHVTNASAQSVTLAKSVTGENFYCVQPMTVHVATRRELASTKNDATGAYSFTKSGADVIIEVTVKPQHAIDLSGVEHVTSNKAAAAEGSSIVVTPDAGYEITSFAASYAEARYTLTTYDEWDDPMENAENVTFPYDMTVYVTVGDEGVYGASNISVSGGDGKVSVSGNDFDNITLHVTGPFSGTATINYSYDICLEMDYEYMICNESDWMETHFSIGCAAGSPEVVNLPATETDGAYSFTMPAGNVTISATVVQVSADKDITANQDPQNTSVYYSTFYDSSVKYALPAGVEAYVADLSGTDLLLAKIAETGQVIPANTAVILKANEEDFTLTESDASAVTFSATNVLEGVDAATNTPSNCYVLSAVDNVVGFYHYNGAQVAAHKAYVIYSGTTAPSRMRFIFDQENTATSVDNAEATISIEKRIENGQLIIIRNGERYNAQGQIVK